MSLDVSGGKTFETIHIRSCSAHAGARRKRNSGAGLFRNTSRIPHLITFAHLIDAAEAVLRSNASFEF